MKDDRRVADRPRFQARLVCDVATTRMFALVGERRYSQPSKRGSPLVGNSYCYNGWCVCPTNYEERDGECRVPRILGKFLHVICEVRRRFLQLSPACRAIVRQTRFRSSNALEIAFAPTAIARVQTARRSQITFASRPTQSVSSGGLQTSNAQNVFGLFFFVRIILNIFCSSTRRAVCRERDAVRGLLILLADRRHLLLSNAAIARKRAMRASDGRRADAKSGVQLVDALPRQLVLPQQRVPMPAGHRSLASAKRLSTDRSRNAA